MLLLDSVCCCGYGFACLILLLSRLNQAEVLD